ncbi:hypothetical protein [Streptomyces sp. NPDC051576]|uniref:hypothetical protein n=1 Tax=Streptomyces sp. NPDC051576 TaxID=3155803 RepID=UPI00343EA979
MQETAKDALVVAFRGEREGTARLTFGQQYIGNALARLRPHDQHMNLGLVAPVPQGAGMADVTRALGALLRAYESLRTRYEPGGGQSLRQVLVRRGSIPLEVVEVDASVPGDGSDPVEDVVARLRLGAFDPAADLPVRAAVLSSGGRPWCLVLALSRMAADGHSAQLVRRYLELEMAAPGRAAATMGFGRQPLDQTAYESSPAGVRAAERALAHWRRKLPAFPDSTPLTGTPDGPRFRRAELASPALGEAVAELSRRLGVSRHSVVLTATMLAIGVDHEGPRAMTVISDNRHVRELRWSVMNLPQRVPVVVDLTGVSFGEAVGRIHVAGLGACRFGLYSPAALRALLTETTVSRGVSPDTDLTFNSFEQGEALSPRRSFTWTLESDREPEGFRFFDFFGPDRMRLYADMLRLSPARVAETLDTVENILVRAAASAVRPGRA